MLLKKVIEIFRFLTRWIVPWSIPLGTFYIAYISYSKRSDLIYIWPMIIASITFTFKWLIDFGQWLSQIDPMNKIVFLNARVVNNAQDSSDSKKAIGFEFQNVADFPIYYIVTKLETKINNTLPEKYHNGNHEIKEIPSKGFAFYDSHFISVAKGNRSLEGFIDFEVSYGKYKKSLTEKLSGKKKVFIEIEEGTCIAKAVGCYDA